MASFTTKINAKKKPFVITCTSTLDVYATRIWRIGLLGTDVYYSPSPLRYSPSVSSVQDTVPVHTCNIHIYNRNKCHAWGEGATFFFKMVRDEFFNNRKKKRLDITQFID